MYDENLKSVSLCMCCKSERKMAPLGQRQRAHACTQETRVLPSPARAPAPGHSPCVPRLGRAFAQAGWRVTALLCCYAAWGCS